MGTFVPLDGRITSLQQWSAVFTSLTGTEVIEIVSPGNPLSGVPANYQITTAQLLTFAQSFNIVQVISDATSATPFAVTSSVARVLINKTSGTATFLTMPLASTMLTPTLIKDIKGDASSNNITLLFTGQLCDGLSQLVIDVNYGWVEVSPLPNGTGFYQSR